MANFASLIYNYVAAGADAITDGAVSGLII